MGKIVKGVAIYTGILIGILVGLAALVFGLMYFIPSFTLFGYGVVSARETSADWETSLKIKETPFGSATIDYANGKSVLAGYEEVNVYDIEILGGDFDVQVIPSTELNLTGIVRAKTSKNLFGFVKGSRDINVSSRLVSYVDSSTTSGIRYKLQIIMNTPSGLISYRDSTVFVEIPSDFAYNIAITTEDGDVSIKGGENNLPLKLESLDVETGKGNFSVGNIATPNSEGKQMLTLAALTMKTTSGKFDWSTVDTLSLLNGGNPGYAVIEADKGDFYFVNISSCIIISGDNVSIKANKVYTQGEPFTYRARNGYFAIEEIDTGGQLVTIVTSNANVSINNMKSSAIITTTYGNIDLTGSVVGNAKVSSTHGNINVNLITGAISASSTYGDINIKYQGKASLGNVHGNITAEFVVSEANKDNYTKVQSEKGKVSLKNQVNNLELIGKESATFSVTFNKLYFGDAYEEVEEEKYDPATHKIVMEGSSSATLYVPLAEYPIELILDGTTAEEKSANNIYSNLITGMSKITTDRTGDEGSASPRIAGILMSTSENGNGCVISLKAKDKASITINDYNKNSLLTQANKWFDLYIYDNTTPLFPINYYYDSYYQYEYATTKRLESNNTTSVDFRWKTNTLINENTVDTSKTVQTKIATAKATINLTKLDGTPSIIPNNLSLVFNSDSKYPCGIFEKSTEGEYKLDENGNYVLLTEDEMGGDPLFNPFHISLTERYSFKEYSSISLPVVSTEAGVRTLTFYVQSNFDGSATYVKIVLTLAGAEVPEESIGDPTVGASGWTEVAVVALEKSGLFRAGTIKLGGIDWQVIYGSTTKIVQVKNLTAGTNTGLSSGGVLSADLDGYHIEVSETSKDSAKLVVTKA